MARIAASWSVLFYFFSVLCGKSLSLDHVPMLMWSTHRSFQGLASPLHEGQIISKHELHLLMKHTILFPDSKNIVLFLQDTLSVDDFTRYSDSSGNEIPFRNVQELLKTSPSLVLPAVDCHTINHLSDYLQESLNWTVVHVDGLDLPHLTVNVSRPNLFVINLHQTKRTNELSLQKELMENDQLIGSFARALQQEGIEASFIYTARRPSRVPMKLDLAWHSRRQLMSAEDQGNDKYHPLNVTNDVNGTTCILFYATNFSLTYMVNEKSVQMNLTDLTFMHQNVDTSSSTCSENNATLSLKYTNVSSIKNLEIRFVMTNKFYKGSARNWFTLDFVYIQKDNESVVQFNVTDISGPAEYSFHCQLVGTGHDHGVTLIPKDDKQQKWEIGISEFQIQAFNVKNTAFAYASDCTSFFTPAIWMGLVSSFVLLLILTYGIHMITNLTTNSRFDDPKGPALSIPQTE